MDATDDGTINAGVTAVETALKILIGKMEDAIEENREQVADYACEDFGLVRLPRDANDEPIRVGDLINDLAGRNLIVERIALNSDGKWAVYTNSSVILHPDQCVHVNDVIKSVLARAAARVRADEMMGIEPETDLTDLEEELRKFMEEKGIGIDV